MDVGASPRSGRAGWAGAPRTHFAIAHDGTHVAYQVVGDGPTDLLVSLGVVSNIDVLWEQPRWGRFIEALASFCRVVIIDRRGAGLSDRRGGFPPWEEQMDDVHAVMAAVGAETAALLGAADASAMFLLFAATHPELTSGLVLFGGLARWTRADDYPCGISSDYLAALRSYIEKDWGSGRDAFVVAPTLANDEGFRQWWGHYQLLATSPGDALAFHDLCSRLDVRNALPLVHAPTVVLHRSGDRFLAAEHGRYVANQIPQAKYVELVGDDHLIWVGDTSVVIDEVEELMTGSRRHVHADRILATVLFTDIVGSTDLASSAGDKRWREMLEQHDALTRFHVERHGGRVVQFNGDGALATFDGPARAVRCAVAIRAGLANLALPIRAGLHTGEIELRGKDVAGIAVHLAERVCSTADAKQIIVSRTVVDLVVGSEIQFSSIGDHALKGMPQPWSLFEVID